MKAFKLLGAASIVALLSFAPAAYAAYPSPAEAIILRNAINNNTVAIRNLGNNNATIAFYLPRMAVCIGVYTQAKTAMDNEIAYYAGGGRDVVVLNAYRSQVASALTGGNTCAGITARSPSESFNANGIKYTNVGWPSNSFVSAVITTTNNFPPNLRTRHVGAFNAGWKFYIFRTPDDFKASPLYATLHIKQAEFKKIRLVGAFTIGGTDNTQVFFQKFYFGPSTGTDGKTPTNQLRNLTDFHPTATITHETEHVNDFRLGTPSQNDAAFVSAFNLGVARYNADHNTTKNAIIRDNFITNLKGKNELFAELATYWDTGHWSVSGVPAQMSALDYSGVDVVFYFSEAWTLMQSKKASNTW